MSRYHALVLLVGGTLIGCADEDPGAEHGSIAEALAVATAEPAGDNCVNGGYKLESGLDDNGDGLLDSDEIQTTSYICGAENGKDGADGASALLVTSDESPGDTCAAGGVKIEAGVDDSRDGTLDSDEVDSTKYVCNGVDGADGADGDDGVNGADGADGADGMNGADGVDGADGMNGADGVDGMNGADGVDGADGMNGADGVDGADGMNGADGADGMDGADGSSCTVSTTYVSATGDPVVRSSCTDGKSAVLNSEPLVPSSATASSLSSGSAANALNPDQAWWQSGLDTGNAEWLQLDYGAAVRVLPTAVRAYIVNGRDGAPKFQGSNDQSTWTDLGTYQFSKFEFSGSPYNGWGTYVDTLSASDDTGYRYLRVYSTGAPYLNYAWLSFDGVVVQR